jgi:hypothetical protein
MNFYNVTKNSKMVFECNVCIESFPEKFLVKCGCDYECCIECAKAFLLDSISDPACMSCKAKWTRDFLTENFKKSFVNKEYKLYREQVLFDREVSKFQATQPEAEKFIKIQKLTKELKELQTNAEPIERKKFVRKCPSEDCHGFLSSSLKCELCYCWACKHCRESKGIDNNKDHVCDPEIIKNVQFMEKDAKPCPKCSSMISKVSGCDQMFCVECHTSFSWKTLKIVTGNIHNPHYFELQRQTGHVPRNPLDILCGRIIDRDFIHSLKNKLVLPSGWIVQHGFGNTYVNTYVNKSQNIKQQFHPLLLVNIAIGIPDVVHRLLNKYQAVDNDENL